MFAGLQSAILLIAAKRQDAIDAALARHDFDSNVAAKIDIETLLEINRQQLLMIAELHEILIVAGDRRGSAPEEAALPGPGWNSQSSKQW